MTEFAWSVTIFLGLTAILATVFGLYLARQARKVEARLASPSPTRIAQLERWHQVADEHGVEVADRAVPDPVILRRGESLHHFPDGSSFIMETIRG